MIVCAAVIAVSTTKATVLRNGSFETYSCTLFGCSFDDVSWGRTDLQGVESIRTSDVSTRKVIRDGQLIIIRADAEYTILGMPL